MNMEWSDTLSVGIAEIDSQHRELIDRMNTLFQALSDDQGSQEIVSAFSFLDDYVVTHFDTEERYMDRIARMGGVYPQHDLHKAEHAAFVRDFREMQADLGDCAANPLFISEFKSWMKNWIILHVMKVDQGLCSLVKSRFPFIGA